MTKYVYLFKEGSAEMKNLLGGKGAGLCEMTNLGLPVPPGFTVTCEACLKYYDDKKVIASEVVEQIMEALKIVENQCGKKFGDPTNPFLVSVRSGARASMPGMMDTILNLGLNDVSVEALAKLTNNRRFAYDSYRRFIQMYSDVVMGIEKEKFDEIVERIKEKYNRHDDMQLDAENFIEITNEFKKLYKKELNHEFIQDPFAQLLGAVAAVFESWNNQRAVIYRRLNDIPSDWGTAVNVQAMVFGNMGEDSGTGVAFTRSPSTGEKKLYGDFLSNAQGEDIVAGIRTPVDISELKKINSRIFDEFTNICSILEKRFTDMQDMEFTIERGKLYMLQTRNGKRTAAAALKIAIDMVNEGLIDEKTAVLRVEPKQLDALLHPQFDEKALKEAKQIAKGLAASPGAATGQVVFSADEAVKWSKDGKKVILVRLETCPEDIEGMHVAQGILTARGGMTSHAAVVARGMGTCCVCGSNDLKINYSEKYFEASGKKYYEGDVISLEGDTGRVFEGAIKTVSAAASKNLAILMGWADKYRVMKVRTNADTPADAKQAIEFGAEGIGLTRTEHMFFAEDRIFAMRQMIVAKDETERRNALNKLLPMQRKDFIGIFEAMGNRPVTIRLLDPPLHEFLPTKKEDIAALAKELNITVENLNATIESLHEFNPMMGHRGCRLAVSYPEIAEIQAQAIIEAAIDVNKRLGLSIVPEIMIPLTCEMKEFDYVKDIVDRTAKDIIAKSKSNLVYSVGTMIEIPRACITADSIAKSAEFFSFGTNDLTQMTFGFSRDDAGKFLDIYYNRKIFENDPFAKVDQLGVGELMKLSIKLGRQTRPNLKVGICGEHGGEQTSVEFCHKIGLDYVSCSPFRVPIARLAAAQANIRFPRNK